MAKGSGGTVYLIGLILAIIVSLVLLGLCYYMNTEWTKTTQEVLRLQEQLEKEKTAVKEKSNELMEARKLINGSPQTAVSYEVYATNILQDCQKTLQETLKQEWVSSEDWKNIKDDQVRRIWENLTKFENKFDKYQSITECYADLKDELRAVIHVIPRLRLDAQAAKEQYDQLRKEIEEVSKTKQREIDNLRGQLLAEQDKGLNLARQKEEEKKKLLDDKDKIQKEMAVKDKQGKLDLAYSESKRKELEARIRELTRKSAKTYFDQAKPDGEVTFSDPQLGFAWVDLGRQHGLKKGTRFLVYSYAKGGRQKLKGWVEVKRVEQDMSQVAILENQIVSDPQSGERLTLPDPFDPIVKGDLVRNPFFEKDRQIRFTFLGTRLTNRWYNQKELERKIEEFGGKVQPKLTVETDIVVLLDKAEEEFPKEYEQAVQFGVDFMRESELLEFVSR